MSDSDGSTSSGAGEPAGGASTGAAMNPQPPLTPGRSSSLDAWMAESPWHPRFVPELTYLLLLMVTVSLQRDSIHWTLYGTSYVVQCLLVVWLLWRFRHLLPEMNWRFHWLALPVGIGVFVAWVVLGDLTRAIPGWFDDPGDNFFEMYSATAAWTLLSLRLLGMSIVVPMFEELFNRSLLLRSFHRPRETGIALFQLVLDLPVIGDMLMNTRLAKRVSQHDRLLSEEFERTPLGNISVFGVAMSTLVFMLAHRVADWPGTIVCGIAYCLLVWATNRKGREFGLGPVIWAHCITNALLWGYVLWTDSWYFL
jgi:hypothetical protein